MLEYAKPMKKTPFIGCGQTSGIGNLKAAFKNVQKTI